MSFSCLKYPIITRLRHFLAPLRNHIKILHYDVRAYNYRNFVFQEHSVIPTFNNLVTFSIVVLLLGNNINGMMALGSVRRVNLFERNFSLCDE